MKIISKFKITPKNKNDYNTEKYPKNENNPKNELYSMLLIIELVRSQVHILFFWLMQPKPKIGMCSQLRYIQ